MELYTKGISNEILCQVLEEMENDEGETIKALILKKSKTPWLLEDNAKKKLQMSLMRKGFAYSEIDRAFSELEER